MSKNSFTDELARAKARPDYHEMSGHVAAYERFAASEFEDEEAGIIAEHIDDARWNDADKALSYVAMCVDQSESESFLGFVGAGILEDLLRKPSAAFLDRVVAEARKTPRFRWLLSVPYKVAISKEAWAAIRPFRITGEHEEPDEDTLPPRIFG